MNEEYAVIFPVTFKIVFDKAAEQTPEILNSGT
jgi:hypothetical protein